MYKELDDAIISFIKETPSPTTHEILNYMPIWVILIAIRNTKRDVFRILDARLQALKKKDVITYNHSYRHWQITDRGQR